MTSTTFPSGVLLPVTCALLHGIKRGRRPFTVELRPFAQNGFTIDLPTPKDVDLNHKGDALEGPRVLLRRNRKGWTVLVERSSRATQLPWNPDEVRISMRDDGKLKVRTS